MPWYTNPPDFARQGGGVVTLVRKGLEAEVLTKYGGDDLVTVRVGSKAIVNMYMAPDGSPDLAHRDVLPIDRMAEVTSGLLDDGIDEVVAGGDWNSRTGTLQTAACAHPRLSADQTVTPRGRNLMRVLGNAEMLILNGSGPAAAVSSGHTSFQPMGQSVIDYIAITANLAHAVVDLCIIRSLAEFSDHAALELRIRSTGSEGDTLPDVVFPAHKASLSVPHREHIALDDLLEDVLASAQTDEDALRDIYGLVWDDTPDVRVWTDGSAKRNSAGEKGAGAGIYWGLNARANCAVRVAGKQRSSRAELTAVACALSEADPNRNLRIFTDSSSTMGLFGPWAAKHAATNWRTCANADIVRNIVSLIAQRRCPTRFTWVKAHAKNDGNDAADMLAKLGASQPLHTAVDGSTVRLRKPLLRDTHAPLRVPKVSCDMPPQAHRTVAPSRSKDKRSRRRGRVQQRKDNNWSKLVNAKSPKKLWDTYRSFTAPRPKRSPLRAKDVKPSFSGRMNAPDSLPPQMSAEHRRTIDLLCASLGAVTVDETEERFFSKPWSAEEVAEIKAGIVSHGGDGAGGAHPLSETRMTEHE